MNYKTLILQLFFLLSFQAYGMESNNNEESGLITTLPEEILEQIVIYNLIQEKRYVSAIPNVCKTWDKIANSAQVIKNLIKINPYSIVKMSGYKQYITINKQLLDACNIEKPDFEEVKKILNDPYADINRHSLDKKTELALTPLCIAAKHSNIELVKLLLNYNANPNASWILDFALSAPSENKIQSSIECFTMLCKAGAKDNYGYSLNEAIRLARTNALYYQTIPLFKNTDTDSNHSEPNSLHILLDPDYLVTPDEKTLILLMRDYNANPHLKDKYNRTAYTLAKELDDQDHNTHYLDIVKKYDKGLEWYTNNPIGCYKKIA